MTGVLVELVEADPELKTFHATVLVTRAEEWCVEAESPEEARELLAQGLGHRCHLGERLQFEWRRSNTLDPALVSMAHPQRGPPRGTGGRYPIH
jgi:hypothetical protein